MARARLKKKLESKDERTASSSHTNIRYLTSEEKNSRIRNLQYDRKAALVKVVRMTCTIKDMIKKEGITLNEEHEKDISEIVCNSEPNFEPDTPQWLLWQQQKEQASKKDARGMRWHPLIIRWCLSIYHTSPKAYRQMTSKKLQFIKLPHINTLKKFSSFTTPAAGFNVDIIQRLIVDSKIDEIPDYKKNVSIIFDEMRIKSDLVFRQSTGQLVGFTDLGDINNELRSFDAQVSEDENRTDFATYILVYMVRGIFSNLIYPFGYFASLGFNAGELYPCTMLAIDVLDSIGFNVRALVSDGASPNRKFF